MSCTAPIDDEAKVDWPKEEHGPCNSVLSADAFPHLHARIQQYLFYVALVFGCHQRPNRSFTFRGRQIPLCARCLGVLIGPLFAPIYFWLLSPWIAFACISVFLIDASTQLVGLRESNNWLRLLGGAAFSASVFFLVIYGVTLCLLNTRP